MRVASPMSLSSAIKSRRLDLKITQEDLAKSAGVSRRTITALEAGKATVRLDVLLRLIEALRLTIDVAPSESGGRGEAVDLDSLLEQVTKP